ncbi:MBL fold metallo-hydrolase [Novosphingobium sp. Gsoil 351]|uniref:GAF domain-containing protein n=1 Tax=Novosphingobium sp. Gsoil 351 TaxID=2675225 RepID=UPI0012B4A950|nr:MBL fold metallo-hydrolase [Novosphingobium sp. Gsoil 351]QGN53474.1 GAF domain-containing protein [Novosphingobium sp. Gsoil 351]
MQVRFWGTRGSIAKPGPDTVRYGGNTSCVQVTSPGGTMIIIDCGTGAHDLGQHILKNRLTGNEGSILISHTHWDHIQGIPFFAPLFVPGNAWTFYAPRGFGDTLRETLAGQMEFTYFPVTLDAFGAKVDYRDLVEQTFDLGDVRITTRFLNHPALTLSYKLECNGATMVYSCDHEPHSHELADGEGTIHGQDREHSEWFTGADLVIHDAQYTPAEYASKVGWGHSTPQYAVQMCREAGVRKLALTHYDPTRTDAQVDAILEELRAAAPANDRLEVIGAAEGMILEVTCEGKVPGAAPTAKAPAPKPLPTRIPVVRIVGQAPALNDPLHLGLIDEGLQILDEAEGEGGGGLTKTAVGLVVVKADSLAPDESILDAIERATSGLESVPPVIVVSDQTKPRELNLPKGADWLKRPFSREFARARMRTALLRNQFKWVPAPIPPDELQRLAALHALGLLDTPAEERFDRLTRVTAALFDVPIALVSLVDANRQWFKSCVGTDIKESSREVSFCAYAVAEREMLVIPDALRDDRFADNPVVSGPPYVRFYAGAPIFMSDGTCAGTLCVIDGRPRDFTDEDRDRLRDLAAIVQQELLSSSFAHAMA